MIEETKEGIIESYIHAGGKVGVLLELNCETDFVGRNPEFKALAHEIAMQIAALEPENVAKLLESEYWKDSSKTIKALIQEKIAKFGENVSLNQFIRYSL